MLDECFEAGRSANFNGIIGHLGEKYGFFQVLGYFNDPRGEGGREGGREGEREGGSK